MMLTKRKEKRVLGMATVSINEQQYSLTDISRSGVAFISPRDFKTYLDKDISLILRIPDSEIFPGSVDMILSGKVRYCQYQEKKGHFKVGIELQNVEPKKQEFIDHMVDFLKNHNSFWGIDEGVFSA